MFPSTPPHLHTHLEHEPFSVFPSGTTGDSEIQEHGQPLPGSPGFHWDPVPCSPLLKPFSIQQLKLPFQQVSLILSQWATTANTTVPAWLLLAHLCGISCLPMHPGHMVFSLFSGSFQGYSFFHVQFSFIFFTYIHLSFKCHFK